MASASEVSNEKNLQHLGVVIVGHVDSGKSTTTGHLLFKLGGMSDRDLEKLRQEAGRMREKARCEGAWCRNCRLEEREGAARSEHQRRS